MSEMLLAVTLWNRRTVEVTGGEDEVRRATRDWLGRRETKWIGIYRRIGPGKYGPDVWEKVEMWNYGRIKELRMAQEATGSPLGASGQEGVLG